MKPLFIDQHDEQTLRTIAIEDYLDNVALEGIFSTFWNKTVKVLNAVTSTLRDISISGYLEEDKVIKEGLIKTDKLLKNLKAKDSKDMAIFMASLNDTFIAVPPGIKSDLEEYAKVLSSISKEIYGSVAKNAGVYINTVSGFINNPDLRKTTKLDPLVKVDFNKDYKQIVDDKSSATDRQKFLKIVPNFQILITLREDMGSLHENNKFSKVMSIKDSLDTSVELTDVLIKEEDPKPYNKKALKELVEQSYTLARNFEEVSRLRLHVESCIKLYFNAVELVTTKL